MNSNLPALISSIQVIMTIVTSEAGHLGSIPLYLQESLTGLSIENPTKDYSLVSARIMNAAKKKSPEKILEALENELERTLIIESISSLEGGLVRIEFSDLDHVGSIDIAAPRVVFTTDGRI